MSSVALAVSGRVLLHKHHHEHGHHEDKCHSISDVLQGAPHLSRFAKALDDAHLPFLTGERLALRRLECAIKFGFLWRLPAGVASPVLMALGKLNPGC